MPLRHARDKQAPRMGISHASRNRALGRDAGRRRRTHAQGRGRVPTSRPRSSHVLAARHSRARARFGEPSWRVRHTGGTLRRGWLVADKSARTTPVTHSDTSVTIAPDPGNLNTACAAAVGRVGVAPGAGRLRSFTTLRGDRHRTEGWHTERPYRAVETGKPTARATHTVRPHETDYGKLDAERAYRVTTVWYWASSTATGSRSY